MAVAPARKTNGLAIAALILGIVGFLPPPFTICTIPAIIMGAISLSQIKKEPGVEGKGMALAGIICGSIALFLWIVAIILIVVFAVTNTTITNSSNSSVFALALVSVI
jgi:hypothetical protein